LLKEFTRKTGRRVWLMLFGKVCAVKSSRGAQGVFVWQNLSIDYQ